MTIFPVYKIKTGIRRASRQAKSYYYLGNEVRCPFCNGRFRRFLPTGVLERSFWQSEAGRLLLGLDYVTVCNQLCPRCGSSERHRLAYFYLKKRLKFESLSETKILDVGPDEFVTRALFDRPDIDYTSIDLSRTNATRKMDLTDLDFEDETFDCVICYHVLEHVKDDMKAMSELYRVLKVGGWGILQVPIWSDRTFEDESVPREQFLEYYGHNDHVRRYGLDYVQRLESAGFKVTVDPYVRTLPEEIVRRYGLLKTEDIYFCEKPAAQRTTATESSATSSSTTS
jgi:SAM-dependent methyltransferase